MGRRITYITLIVSWAWVANAHAQQVATTITRTAGAGDLGTKVTRAGNSFDINGGTRPSNGRNLFHSFDQFSLGRGDIANFANDTGLATQNILSRVTGGSSSDIFGTIKTTGFPGAALFLLNPHGIVFGPSAELDLQGSFHASTGDFIRLEDEVQFNALPSGQDALLTMAPPEAFGFLGDHPAPIEVNASFLKVPDGKTLSLVGGDITVTNGAVNAPGGQINLISTASPGEVMPTLSGAKLEANITSSQLGTITVKSGGVVASGPVGGAVVIRGGQFVVEDALVLAETFGGNDGEKGAGIDIRVGRLDMHSLDKEKPALIRTDTTGRADGGDVFVETDTMRLTGAGFCETCFPTGILSQTGGEGNAGKITVEARQMNLESGGTITTSSFSQGRSGDLVVDADNIMLDGEATGFTTQSFTPFPAGAGNIDIKTDGLTLINGAQIRSLTGGPGRAGDISIQADRIFLSGSSLSDPSQRSSITSQQLAFPELGNGIGDAGHIKVTTKSLEVRNGANINAVTFGEGDGGNMSVTAHDILLVGDPSIEFTGLSNETQNEGNAGNLTVSTNTLDIRDNARIEASTLFDQETRANKFSGKGGDLTVTANDIFINGEGAGIFAKSTNKNPAATSGNIRVTANDSIRLQNQGKITVETVLADAGDIDIHVNELLLLRNNSSITTSVAGGRGDGGNINIDPVFTILDSGSQIVAQAREGAGGNIRIVTDFFFASPDSLVSASSDLGIDGVVDIESPDTDLNAGLVELPADFFDAATLLTQGCAPGADLSRLVVRKYEVLPDSPAALRVPPPGGLLNADAQGGGFALTRETLGSGFEHSSACGGDG